MQRAIDFKLSLVRMLYGLLVLGSLLNNFQYTAWQSSSWGAFLYLFLIAAGAGLSLAVLLGWRTRTAIPCLAACVFGYHTINHFVLHMGWFQHSQVMLVSGLLILNSGNTDRFFALSRPMPIQLEDNERTLRLFRWFLILIYWGCAYAKLRGDFLSGFSLETQMIENNWGSLPLPFQIPGWIYASMSVAAMILEFILPFFLMWSKTANLAVMTAFIFHLIMLSLLHPLIISFVMPVGLIAFVDDRLISRWAGE